MRSDSKGYRWQKFDNEDVEEDGDAADFTTVCFIA